MDLESKDGFPIELFVKAPPEEFQCAICYNILNNPTQCKNGHLMCLGCFEKAVNANPRCPVCVVSMNSVNFASNIFVKNQICCLVVRCHVPTTENNLPYCFDECHWTGPLSALQDHIDGCLFRLETSCPFFQNGDCLSSCLNSYSYSAMISHLTDYGFHSKRKVVKLNESILALKSTQCLIPDNVYCGETTLGKRNGLGVMRLKQGPTMLPGYETTYVGSWLNHKKHGQGIYRYSKHLYVGEFYEDEMHGECLEFVNPGGDRCSGTFRHDVMHGFGKKTKANSTWSYEGEWVNDQRHGKGKFTSDCGEVFVGDFVRNSIRGEGVLTTLNQDTFTGTFRRGRCHGDCVWRNAAGDVLYSGQFEDHKMHGQGIATAPDGSVFEGGFKNGLKSGQGKLTFSGGDIYKGEFLKDSAIGVGSLTTTSGQTLIGCYIDGKFIEKLD
jgi:hypothetical protein